VKAPFLWSRSASHTNDDSLSREAAGPRGAGARWWAASALAAALLLPLGASAQADPSWSALSPQQRSALAPLQSEWQRLEPQHRMQQRMNEWSRMSPEQRGEARANFQRSKELPRRDRQAEWEAYRALPQDERDALAARARPGAAELADDSGSRLRRAVPQGSAAQAADGATQSPRYRERSSLPPSLTRGNPGATTNLITAPPSPPAHQQQSGLPRITATPGVVDRTTLLPQRGPQGAGVRGSPASNPKNQGKQK